MNEQELELDRVFQALSDSTRRSILLKTRKNGETVSDIAAEYDMSLPAVTKHLNILERAGLISRRKDGRKRICQADPEKLNTAMEWLEYYQQYWDDRLESLKAFVEKNAE